MNIISNYGNLFYEIAQFFDVLRKKAFYFSYKSARFSTMVKINVFCVSPLWYVEHILFEEEGHTRKTRVPILFVNITQKIRTHANWIIFTDRHCSENLCPYSIREYYSENPHSCKLNYFYRYSLFGKPVSPYYLWVLLRQHRTTRQFGPHFRKACWKLHQSIL